MASPLTNAKSNRPRCTCRCHVGRQCASVGNTHLIHRCDDPLCSYHDEWRAYFDGGYRYLHSPMIYRKEVEG